MTETKPEIEPLEPMTEQSWRRYIENLTRPPEHCPPRERFISSMIFICFVGGVILLGGLV